MFGSVMCRVCIGVISILFVEPFTGLDTRVHIR